MQHDGLLEPTDEHLQGIAALALALGRGSTKLCEALSLVYGNASLLQERASQIDQQLQPLVSALCKNSRSPGAVV